MRSLLGEIATVGQNVVAVCDVDEKQIAGTRKAFGQLLASAKVHKDFRQLLEREKSVDAVVIATPDHWHASICTAAIRAGKHVYCEKPLTHTVGEARQLGVLAKKSKVVTQTGNQGSASPNFRRSIELVQAGVLGTVSEIHAWHPPHGCPPWRVEITGAAQPGENTLEIEVVNLWPNRLMGDRKLPAAQRRTRTRMFMGGLKDDQLPSGLLGPVTIQTVQPSSAR